MQTRAPQPDRTRRQERGFALILAILSLLLLTFLGLTLAATTTTELQIAANHRWGQQARYNAEAGLQAAQIILRDIAAQDSGSLALALHGAQPPWTAANPPVAQPSAPGRVGPGADQWGVQARHFENWECSGVEGLVGYGTVLVDRTGGILYQNVDNVLGQPLNGAVTIWVRRAVAPIEATAEFNFDMAATRVVVTAEGTAPFFGDVTQATNLRRRQQAVRVMEAAFSVSVPDEPCSLEDINQQGLGAAGANFSRCTDVDDLMGRRDTDLPPNP